MVLILFVVLSVNSWQLMFSFQQKADNLFPTLTILQVVVSSNTTIQINPHMNQTYPHEAEESARAFINSVEKPNQTVPALIDKRKVENIKHQEKSTYYKVCC